MDFDIRNCRNLSLWCFLITVFYFSVLSFAADRITPDHSIRDGDTIISVGERFALGFFSPRGSGFRYLGIWFNKVANESIVWVANRDRPISGNGGVLSIGNDGNLMVFNGNGSMIWSSDVTVDSSNSTAVLMDTGNLALHSSNNSTRVIWQSFDHPTDTYLPDMRLQMNVRDGEARIFSSWKSSSDPSPGNYTMGADPRGSPQIVIWEGMKRRWRSGHWNGLIFFGIPSMRANLLFGFTLFNEGEGNLYFTYTPSNISDLIKFGLTWEGTEMTEKWNDGLQEWSVIQSHPANECETYNHCGAFGKCNAMNTPRCSCMEGFVPKDADQWRRGNWSSGCTRRKKLQCEENNSSSNEGTKSDGFVQVEGLKLPDFVDHVGSEDLNDCEKKCLENCSCTAYAYVSGINCMIWNRDLIDVQQFGDGGSPLFIRLNHSELGENNQVTKIVVITVVVGIVILSVLIWLLWRYKTKCQETCNVSNNEKPRVGSIGDFSADLSGPCDLGVEGQQGSGTELTIYTSNYVAAATDNFSDENKLGEGGFGHVYKGTLPDGQEIAVKRLSRKSDQGIEEFKNEITLIAKLQHRNLVRLLGCCIEREEKMLLYELHTAKKTSNVKFCTDPAKRSQLDWSTRFNIIEGIARGLLYLHRDSRLRIIHRDLKASNILLDEEMNPKISDFGMARIFGGNQNEENTNRVVGTYGYMAPEYAMEGLFSLKSDVYSFGVLLLEIVSGRRNNSFRSSKYSNIIGNVWKLWERGGIMELLDPSIANSCSQEQVQRCIHVGMLCVQDMAAQRPNMSAVVLMLESDNVTLPMPRQPTFTSTRHSMDADMWNEKQDLSSNNVTISVIVGR